MPFWAVELAKVNRAHVARRFLRLGGFESYHPMVIEPHRERPVGLFGGYLFVRVALQWHGIRSTPGIVRLVMVDAAQPARVADHIVDEIRAREGRDGLIRL